MDFSIIVVNWNGESLLRECLCSIRDASANLCLQTIVVDNASKDNSVDLVRREFPEVELICADRNLGFGAANNLAMRHARGEFVMFLNPDAAIEGYTLHRARIFLRDHPDVACVGCMVVDESDGIQPLGIQRDPTPWLEFLKIFACGGFARTCLQRWLPTKDPSTSGYVDKLYGSNLIIRAEIAKALNGFDERFFMYCEDVDLCRRIRAADHKLYYLAETRIRHRQGSCSRSAPRGFSTLMQCDALEKYMRKYHGFAGSLCYRFLLFTGASLRLLTSCLLFGASRLGRQRDATAGWAAKCFSNWMMVRWSCYSKRAFIPE